MQYLLGIDAGTTVIKSVLFALDGTNVGVASRRVGTVSPAPHLVERDQDVVWKAVVHTVREVMVVAGVGGTNIAAIGVTGHGDGLYLVDASGSATAPAVLSLDTRASAIVVEWETDGTSERALRLSGQRPFPAAPAALLAWFQRNHPDVLDKADYALGCKDMIKARMTGIFETEHTEASLSFVNVESQVYDPDILDLYGLSEQARLLPIARSSQSISGHLNATSATALGLPPGIPIGAGAHDIDCSAIGSGVIQPGQVAMIAGSYSINECVTDRPEIRPGRYLRNFVTPGQWLAIEASPTSATNLEWFVQNLGAATVTTREEISRAFELVDADIASIEIDPDEVVYLPFLYGSHVSADASGTLLGVRGWHSRGHLLRAVMQGVAMSHRVHIEALASTYEITSITLSGGASQSERWSQTFADVLDRTVEVAGDSEACALGAALLAGIATGLYDDLNAAVSTTVRPGRRFSPSPDRARTMHVLFSRYQDAIEALTPYWRRSKHA